MVNNRTLIIYGFPTTGKSTFIEMATDLGYKVFDTDDYLKPEDNKEVKLAASNKVLHEATQASLVNPKVIVVTNLNFGRLYQTADYYFLPKDGRLVYYASNGRGDLKSYASKFDQWENDMIGKVLPSGVHPLHSPDYYCSLPIDARGRSNEGFAVMLDHDSFISDYFRVKDGFIVGPLDTK